MHVVLKLLLQSRHHCIDTTDLIPFLASSTMNNGPGTMVLVVCEQTYDPNHTLVISPGTMVPMGGPRYIGISNYYVNFSVKYSGIIAQRYELLLSSYEIKLIVMANRC